MFQGYSLTDIILLATMVVMDMAILAMIGCGIADRITIMKCRKRLAERGEDFML